MTAGFSSVNPGSLSPHAPGLVCISRKATQHCSPRWARWSVHPSPPPLHTGDRRGCWPAVTRSSLAVPLGQDHEGGFAFSSLGLFAVFLLSLSLSLSLSPPLLMSSLLPAGVEELRLPSVVFQMLQNTLGSS